MSLLNSISRERKVHDGPHFIRLGDIFIMRDDEYSKGDNKIPDTKCIRYERPVVITSACEDIFTVIPLTSKENFHEFRYKMKIENGKDSYALFSQITTVDRDRLDHRIGTLRTEVFNDILECYSYFLQCKIANGTTGVAGSSLRRRFPIDKDKLDIIRFYPWHVYIDEETDRTFIVLELDNKELIALDIELGARQDAYNANRVIGNLETFCGLIDPTSVHYIGDTFYINKDYELIGIEDNTTAKNRIVALMKAMFNININNSSISKHPLVGITNVIRRFENINYLEAVRYVLNLHNNKSLYHMILTSDRSVLDSFFALNEINMCICQDPFVLSFIRKKMIQSLNVMDCNTKYLDFAAENMPDVLNPIVLKYANSIDDQLVEGEKVLSDDEIQKDSFHNKNIKWVARYIHNYIDTLKSNAVELK